MQKPRLEIGLVLAFIPLTLGALLFCGFYLSRINNPHSDYTPVAILFSVIVLLLAAVSFTLVLTLLSQAISTIGNFKVGFWPSTSALLQKFAVWLIIHWLLIWGIPFILGMSVYFYAKVFYSLYVSLLMGFISAIIALLALRKILPRDFWVVSSQFDPARSLGFRKGFLLFFVLTFVGFIYLQSCYIFEVSLSGRKFMSSDQIEVRAYMSGRVTNHSNLRAILASVSSNDWTSDPIAFNIESDGHYVTWIDLKKTNPGKYRVIVFFNNYNRKPLHQKYSLWLGHNYLIKEFVIQIQKSDYLDKINTATTSSQRAIETLPENAERKGKTESSFIPHQLHEKEGAIKKSQEKSNPYSNICSEINHVVIKSVLGKEDKVGQELRKLLNSYMCKVTGPETIYNSKARVDDNIMKVFHKEDWEEARDLISVIIKENKLELSIRQVFDLGSTVPRGQVQIWLK